MHVHKLFLIINILMLGVFTIQSSDNRAKSLFKYPLQSIGKHVNSPLFVHRACNSSVESEYQNEHSKIENIIYHADEIYLSCQDSHGSSTFHEKLQHQIGNLTGVIYLDSTTTNCDKVLMVSSYWALNCCCNGVACCRQDVADRMLEDRFVSIRNQAADLHQRRLKND